MPVGPPTRLNAAPCGRLSATRVGPRLGSLALKVVRAQRPSALRWPFRGGPARALHPSGCSRGRGLSRPGSDAVGSKGGGPAGSSWVSVTPGSPSTPRRALRPMAWACSGPISPAVSACWAGQSAQITGELVPPCGFPARDAQRFLQIVVGGRVPAALVGPRGPDASNQAGPQARDADLQAPERRQPGIHLARFGPLRHHACQPRHLLALQVQRHCHRHRQLLRLTGRSACPAQVVVHRGGGGQRQTGPGRNPPQVHSTRSPDRAASWDPMGGRTPQALRARRLPDGSRRGGVSPERKGAFRRQRPPR